MVTATQSPGLWARVRQLLPEGRELPEAEWRVRHRTILVIVFAHAAGLALFGVARGWPLPFDLGEGALIAALGAVAAFPILGRRFRSSVAALGLVTSSAVLVQFSAAYGQAEGGYIEAHFHYFVVVALVAMYQDWAPFLLTVAYVALDHGVIGTLFPQWVYNHGDAVAHPWKWAGIHAILVLAECAALIAVWRASEQARARADLVLRSTGEGILGVGLDGRVTFANPAAQHMTGLPESGLVGRPASTLFSGGAPAMPGVQAGLGRTLETLLLRGEAADGKPSNGIANGNNHHDHDERGMPVEVVATPILRGHRVEGTVLAFKDITERRHAEEEQARRLVQEAEVRRLQEEDRFKTLFINTAAHELRTPLTPLKLQLHVLKGEKRGQLNDEQRRIMRVLGRNLDRLGQLVEDVLDVGRLQAKRIHLEAEPVEVGRLVADVVEAFQEVAAKNAVALAWQPGPTAQVVADPRRINQILFNLLDNAFKFTPAGGRVEVSLTRQGDKLQVAVRDSGAGLSEEDMAKLFKPFSQAHDPMQRTRAGTGLGLYISRGFAQLHGGDLECASPGRGQGATFTLSLPWPSPA